MTKNKVNTGQGDQYPAPNTNSSNGCLILIGFFIFMVFLFYTCSDDKEETKEVVSSETSFDKSSFKSKDFVKEMHSKIFGEPEERKEIPEMTLDEISEIHYYLCVERWNSGGDIGMRWGTKYEEAAENLNISVSKLRAADNYYHYRLQRELTASIKNIYNGHANVVIDYYNPLLPTAYCGLNTLIGGITVYGQKKNSDFKEEAKNVAVAFASEMPEWVTGFKLHYTNYKDTILQTGGDVDIGFLWRRGEDIQIMHSSRGLYGSSIPTENRNWHGDDWNDLKVIEHPTYYYIKR